MAATQSLVRVVLPVAETNVNVRHLSQHAVETFRGQTTAAVTLTNEPSPPVVVRLNGTTLDPTAYTLVARTITLPRALVSGDELSVEHQFRPQRP